MAEVLTVGLTALALTFVAELGDKTQIVVLALAARGARSRVVAGAVAAFAILTFVAVYLASGLATLVSPTLIRAISAGVFLLFAVLALREAHKDDDADDESLAEQRSAGFGAAFGLILVAELGDKTQLAAAALAAANQEPLVTGIGAVLGFAAATVLAALAGGWIGRRLSERTLAYGAAAAFGIVGLVLLVSLWI